jgi:sensor domain CHASE-containing protein
MDMHTVLTHGLTYLAALALPLWLVGEQLLASWTLRKPTIERVERSEKVERKAHHEVDEVEDGVVTAQKAA